jgi:hypothetical protein
MVDHICFYPLGSTNLMDSAKLSCSFASQLHEIEDIPIYLYGSAYQQFHQPAVEQPRKLQDIRRQLGYFQQEKELRTCSNSIRRSELVQTSFAAINNHFPPDLLCSSTVPSTTTTTTNNSNNSSILQEKKGLTCIGCVPFVRNFNIRIAIRESRSDSVTDSVTDCEIAASHRGEGDVTAPAVAAAEEDRLLSIQQMKDITRLIRKEHQVEALTLAYDTLSYEIACNLLTPREITPEYILDQVQTLCQERNLEIIHSYSTGPSEEELLDQLTL